MENENLEFVMNDLSKKGLKFTTWSVLKKEFMKDPEYRRLHEERKPAFAKLCAEIDAHNRKAVLNRGFQAQTT